MESTHSICGQASLSPVIMLARNYLCGVIGLLIRVTQIFGDSISRLMVFGIWRHVIHAIRVYNAGANDRNPHRRLWSSRRGEYAIERLHLDVAGPFNQGLDGSRYWLTIVYDFTGWIEIIPIPRRQHFVIESLRFFLDHSERPEWKCRRIRLGRVSKQVGDEMKFMLFSRAIQRRWQQWVNISRMGLPKEPIRQFMIGLGLPSTCEVAVQILAGNRSNRSFPLQPVAVIKTQHDSVPSVVWSQTWPITTESNRIERGILDPTKAKKEAYGSANKALHPARLWGKHRLPYPSGRRKNCWDSKRWVSRSPHSSLHTDYRRCRSQTRWLAWGNGCCRRGEWGGGTNKTTVGRCAASIRACFGATDCRWIPRGNPYLSRETISRTYCLGVTITRKPRRRFHWVTMTRSPLLLYREIGPCRPHEATIPSDLYHLLIRMLSLGLAHRPVAASNKATLSNG